MLLARGAGAAIWTSLAGLAVVAAPVLLAWVAAGAREPLAAAVSAAATGWLFGLGATVVTPEASWSLTPLGLTLVLLVLSYRAGMWAADGQAVRQGTRVAAVLLSAALTAAALAGTAAALTSLELVQVDPGEAAAHAALVTGTGAAAGLLALERTGVDRLLARLPGWVIVAIRPTATALAVLTSAAAAALTTAMVASFGVISTLLQQIDPGVAGTVALLLVCLAYLPTALVWSLAVLVGPGFQLGAVVHVSSGAATSGPLPGFPLLGAVPESVPSVLAPVGVLVVLLAGVVAGLQVARAAERMHRWWEPAASAAVVGLAVAGAVAVAGWAASGAMGPGDLSWVGVGGLVAGLSGALLAAAAAGTASLVTYRAGRSSPKRDDSEALSAS